MVENPYIYTLSVNGSAFVIRDEVVYNTTGFVENEGEKVSVNTPLLLNEDYKNYSGYNYKAIDSEIKTLEKVIENYDELSIEKEDIDANKLNQLYRELEDENYYNVQSWYSDNFLNFNMTENQIQERLSRLKMQRDLITKEGRELLTLNAGIIQNGIDYYENILSYDIVSDLEKDFYFSDQLAAEVEASKSGYKVINNLSYVLRITIPSSDLYKSYEIGSGIKVKINENTYEGIVESLSAHSDETIISAVFQDGFDSIKDIRTLNLELINYETSAYEIPKSAVIEKEAQNGVYILDNGSIVRFVPVEILKNQGSDYIIEAGKDHFITINDKTFETIKPYDEVLLNPRAVTEGDLIN